MADLHGNSFRPIFTNGAFDGALVDTGAIYEARDAL